MKIANLSFPPTEEEDRKLAEELGWTLAEFYDTMGKGFLSIEERDKYIKEQRKSLSKI